MANRRRPWLEIQGQTMAGRTVPGRRNERREVMKDPSAAARLKWNGATCARRGRGRLLRGPRDGLRHAAPEAVHEGGPGEGGNGCGEGGEERERQKRAQEREADGEGALPDRSAPGPFPVGLGKQGEVVRRSLCHERRELRPASPTARVSARAAARADQAAASAALAASARARTPGIPASLASRHSRYLPGSARTSRAASMKRRALASCPGPVLTEHSHSGVRTVTTAVLLSIVRIDFDQLLRSSDTFCRMDPSISASIPSTSPSLMASPLHSMRSG